MSPLQWLGIAMMVAGALVYAWPRIRAMFPTSLQVDDLLSDGAHGPDVIAELMDRMEFIARLQEQLEARGHLEEAKIAGTWYALLRDPIRDQEAPRP